MATRKRNEWLDANISDDEDRGYDSEAAEESRGAALGARALKRRRVNSDDSDEEAENDNRGHVGALTDGDEPLKLSKLHAEEDDAAEDEDEQPDGVQQPPTKNKQLKLLTPKQLERSQKAASRTGVLYLSRVPPFMKPHTLRHLLEGYGEIGRIFLTPEDAEKYRQRKRAGGNKKKSFTDGWVEFLNKKNAKLVAETLNAQTIGGKKGGWYRDDLWNIKYLKGFKWHHLTEQIANENAERAARMRAEISRQTRENKEFVNNVERAKMLNTMEAKRKKKILKGEGVQNGAALEESVSKRDDEGFRRQFRQNEVKMKSKTGGEGAEQSEDVKRVLSKIF